MGQRYVQYDTVIVYIKSVAIKYEIVRATTEAYLRKPEGTSTAKKEEYFIFNDFFLN